MSDLGRIDVQALRRAIEREGVDGLRRRFLLATALGKPVAVERARRLARNVRPRPAPPPADPEE